MRMGEGSNAWAISHGEMNQDNFELEFWIELSLAALQPLSKLLTHSWISQALHALTPRLTTQLMFIMITREYSQLSWLSNITQPVQT